MQKLAWNYIFVQFCGLLAQIRLGQTRRAFGCRVLETEIWKSELHKSDSGGSGHSLSIYIEFLPGFGKLFHGNIPIRTNFYCHSCFMMRATHAGNLKSQLKKASRRFCSSNLGNCNYICFLGGEWGGLMCPKDTISPLIFSPSLGRSDSIQRRTN